MTNFERCFCCRHADEKDANAGTLVCLAYNMFINAMTNEIPDDCVEFEDARSKPEGNFQPTVDS